MRRSAAFLLVLALSSSLLAACSTGSQQPERSEALSSAARLGVDTAVTSFFDDPTGYSSDVRSLLIRIRGEPVAEHYVAGAARRPQELASVTTSVVSLLVGVAIGRGELAGVDATLADLLPDYRSSMPPEVRGVTLRQLLTMTAGFRDDTAEWTGRAADSDWVKVVLGSPRSTAGRFRATDAGSQLLSAILEQATGRSLLSYSRRFLFGPLGIRDVTWARDPLGRNLAYAGLRLTAADLATIGQLVLDEGRWQGEQLVPTSWVREATSTQISLEQLRQPSGEYGYGWWVLDANNHPAYAATSPTGQILEVVPDQELVFVLTTRIRRATRVGVSGPLSWMAQLVVPAVEHG